MASSCHISGVTNVVADQESRNFDGSTEWSLNTKVFEDISNIWGSFQIDLFASRLNYKVQDYVSWKPDPGAKFVNAFHMNWANSYFYCFPPSSVIASCLQKIKFQEATGVILIPLWQTQPWFTTLLHLLIDRPLESDFACWLAESPARLPSEQLFRESYRNYLTLLVRWNTEAIPTIPQAMV